MLTLPVYSAKHYNLTFDGHVAKVFRDGYELELWPDVRMIIDEKCLYKLASIGQADLAWPAAALGLTLAHSNLRRSEMWYALPTIKYSLNMSPAPTLYELANTWIEASGTSNYDVHIRMGIDENRMFRYELKIDGQVVQVNINKMVHYKDGLMPIFTATELSKMADTYPTSDILAWCADEIVKYIVWR